MDRRRLIIIGGAAAALVLIVALVLLLPKGGRDRAVETVAQPAPTAEAPLVAEGEPLTTPTPGPTPEPAAEPQAANPQRAATRPAAVAEGFLPVFTKANTQEKIVAITVDDCFQAENLEQIVNKAIEVGAKLTIFPIEIGRAHV